LLPDTNQKGQYIMEITTTQLKKIALKTLKVVLILAVIGAGIYGIYSSRATWLGWIQNLFPKAQETQEVTPALAAEIGIETYLTLDYTKTFEEWAEAVCAISTEDGCSYVTEVFGPVFWRSISEGEAQSTCLAEAVRMVKENEDPENPMQLWKVEIDLQDFPDIDDPHQTMYVIVAQSESEDGPVWKFERILLDEEVAALKEAGMLDEE
jgi:hypothetical protein